LTRVFGGLWSRYGGWGWSRIRLFLPSARFDWEREAADTWMNSVVALAIAWLGDRFPRPLIRVSKIARNGDYVPVARHAAIDLWNWPNRFYGRRTLEKAIGLSLKVDGNAYLYKVRDNLGRVCELWWIPHYRILPTWPSDGSAYIDGYRVWLDTAVYHLPPEDVIHIRDGIDPRNERLGLSALRANLREVCTINFEAGYTAGLLKNSGVPSLAIMPDGDSGPRPSPEAAERIKERFVEETSGDMTGRPIVLSGKYKVVELGFTPESMTLKDLPRNAEARITSSCGVAAMSLGLPDPNKTYSNLAEANRSSWGTIVAVQELVAETLRFQLLTEPISAGGYTTQPMDPMQYVVEYDYTHIQELQESLDAIHGRTREDFKADLTTKNEAREQLGYEPHPDGDLFFSDIQAGKAAGGLGGDDEDEEPALAIGGNGKALGNGRAAWRP
jgi:HK97 family phage portal protein